LEYVCLLRYAGFFQNSHNDDDITGTGDGKWWRWRRFKHTERRRRWRRQ